MIFLYNNKIKTLYWSSVAEINYSLTSVFAEVTNILSESIKKVQVKAVTAETNSRTHCLPKSSSFRNWKYVFFALKLKICF